MKDPRLHIGCSSYYNKLWKGIFYPEDLPGSKWFEYYAQHFSTYELNGTFYKFPTVKGLQTWYKKVPDGFTFSLKVPKHITHIKRLADCDRELNDFYTAVREGLADKLACILFQLPPSFSYSKERLELVLNAANPGFKNVVEFRNETWWRQDVMDVLAQRNIAFSSVNYPKLPTTVMANTALGYIRFHGNPKLFYSQYSEEELQEIYEQIMAQSSLKEVYIYFNNTASEAAIINAMYFKKMAKNSLRSSR